MCLGHFRRHTVLDAEQLDGCQVVVGFALMDGGPVAEAEVVEPPQHLDIDVAAKLAAGEIAVVAVESITARQGARHGSRETADQQARNQRPQFLLLQQRQGGLHLARWDASSGRWVRPIAIKSSTGFSGSAPVVLRIRLSTPNATQRVGNRLRARRARQAVAGRPKRARVRRRKWAKLVMPKARQRRDRRAWLKPSVLPLLERLTK